ncbi:hypothetical protein BU24DRAFT_143463 [Aaosphaeria arxii CBS 175.79]|uniref:Uncharacterized protein n=1 Tax=Aaosphaeria arxii CBS 175.79 TaxID=1450172 RepID=A0A6A5XVW4_9PLEO|nr:uncharacterized protein BU24DRAFT_143463 [Aaosphaeria arxii CBS 175.79]KAF2017086.1 hypothetical protein BU24DRAFT_143463 [Aaosphaeria arxii CBS 175.79]
MSSKPLAAEATTTLHDNPTLNYKLHVFLYDLRHFRSSPSSRSRLDAVVDTHYLGAPYFDPVERSLLLSSLIIPSFPSSSSSTTTTDTLQDTLDDFFRRKLEKRVKGRIEKEGDGRICAAHDLAPVFERAFGVRMKELEKNRGFMKLLRTRGLELREGQVWCGLGKGRGKDRREGKGERG